MINAKIDWLTLSAKGKIKHPEKYRKETLSISNRQFNRIDEYFIGSQMFFNVCSEPKQKILKDDLIIIKFSNHLLYTFEKFMLFNEFIADSNLQDVKISRIDFCNDFNTFANRLHPDQVVNQMLRGKYVKRGLKDYNIRGYQVKEKEYISEFSYLKYGSNDSDIKVYLYNKTLEMNQVKFKPYIFDTWCNQKLDTLENIYRLEFSIKPYRLRLCANISGELIELSYKSIQDQSFVNSIYCSLVLKYFDFRLNDNQAKSDRMKRVVFFTKMLNEFTFVLLKPYQISNRSDKIFINKALSVYDEIRHDQSLPDKIYLHQARKHANNKSLSDYMQRKMRYLGIENTEFEITTYN